ncbi:cold-shock protein [Serratia fonticola]|uniref:cold-shock protein n=1 Tax=Serratia fonticola TaxID=47917 RepID=UPI000BFD6383|nr:cold-shock protein [Serratia fonticola]ATM78541.1 cold-shock protein [Serratia fonticola]
MSRDQGLEEILREDFETLNALAEKVMFLLARLLDGKLIFAARDDGMLVRLGKGRDSWTFEQPDIVPMISRGRKIQGWVRYLGAHNVYYVKLYWQLRTGLSR